MKSRTGIGDMCVSSSVVVETNGFYEMSWPTLATAREFSFVFYSRLALLQSMLVVTPRCEHRDRVRSAVASSIFHLSREDPMTPYKKRMNPFIQRMVGDMQLRNLADATIDAYTYHVDKFCQFFGKPADQLGPEEIRQYQLYLVNEKKSSWSSFNQAVCGLRFLYEVTLQRPWAVRHIPFGKRPKKLPVVLSDEEASRLLQCIDNPKHRAVISDLLCGRAATAGSDPPATWPTSTGTGNRSASAAEKGAKKESCPPRPGCSTSCASTGN